MADSTISTVQAAKCPRTCQIFWDEFQFLRLDDADKVLDYVWLAMLILYFSPHGLVERECFLELEDYKFVAARSGPSFIKGGYSEMITKKIVNIYRPVSLF